MSQVVGQGGCEELAQAVVDTPLGLSFANEEFWSTVLLFFVENPMLDPGMVGPIVDYIIHQKYAPREVMLAEGAVVEAEPPQPNYAMKGRSAIKLLRHVDDWHAQLHRESAIPTAAGTTPTSTTSVGTTRTKDCTGPFAS